MTTVLDSVELIREYGNSSVSFPWLIRDKFFTNSKGELIRHKGFSFFKGIEWFRSGVDLRPRLSRYKKYNAARIFLYVDPKDWGSDAWSIPSELEVYEFCQFMLSQGFLVKLTLCTTTATSSQLSQIKNIVNYLKIHRCINLILEAVNEPYVEYEGELYGKTDPNEFKNLLQGSGYPYSSGVYANNHKFYGQYWLDHSSRNLSNWFSKGGHSLMEAYQGGGPNDGSEPALKMPCVEDEPIRPDQCNYDLLGAYSYAASCALMGAGATVHTQSGKLANIPTSEEQTWIDAFSNGLDIFPLDAANQPYQGTIVEPGQSEEARTYICGKYSVRIKQVGKTHPNPSYKPLDNFGIAWSK